MKLKFSMIASHIVPLQEEERIVPITYALEDFKQPFKYYVCKVLKIKEWKKKPKSQYTLIKT